MSSSATRTPLIDTSICSPGTLLPNSCPVGIECSIIRNVYSPSAGKMCDDGDAAAGAERRAFDLAHLVRRARNLVIGFGRRRLRVADRQRADRAGRAQVAFEHRRREALGVGHVVEAVADGVGRQVGVDVHVEVQQVAQRRARTRRGSGAGTAGGPGFGLSAAAWSIRVSSAEASRVSGSAFGPPGARRRHHAGAQLADHFLGDLGVLGGRSPRRSRPARGRPPWRDRYGR